ncbi:MAG: DUF3857 domain-containing protein [Phycisphaerae bacterium]|nr:DUF3857 domain-containing protein [Phycisphaerae bacterium]
MILTRIATALCASFILIVGGIASIGMLTNKSQGAGILVLVAIVLLGGVCGLLATLPWKGREHARAAAAIGTALYFVLCILMFVGCFIYALAGAEKKDVAAAHTTALGAAAFTAFTLTYVSLLLRLKRWTRGIDSSIEKKPSKAPLIWYIATVLLLASCGAFNGFFVVREAFRKSLLEKDVTAAQPTLPESLIQVPEFNYQIRSPGGHWRKAEKGAISKDASLVLVNSVADQGCVVVTEEIGDDSGIDLETFIANIKTNVSGRTTSFEAGALEPLEVSGASGQLMPVKVRIKNLELQYYYWCALHNGIAYQLIHWGSASKAAEVEAAARDFRSRFSFIDPNWSPQVALAAQAKKELAPEYGLTLDLEHSGWYLAKNSGAAGEAARFTAQSGKDLALELIPINLSDHAITDDAVTNALLRFYSFNFPGEKIASTGESEAGGVRISRYSAERESEGVRYAYRFRILRRGPIACLAAAWQPASKPDREALDKILDRASLGEIGPAATKQPAEGRDATFWNNAGITQFGHEKYQEAHTFFRRAAEIDPKDSVYVLNAAKALREQNKFAEAASYMKDRLGTSPSEAMLSLYAETLEQSGDSSGAIEAYGRVLEIPASRQKAINARNALFIAAKRFDEADSDLEKYKDLGPNRTLRAKILRARGQVDEAAAALRAGLDADPVDTAAGEDLIELCDELDRHNDIIEASDLLSKSGYRTAYTLYHKGAAEFSLDRLPAARLSLEEAQKLAPSDQTVKDLLQRVHTRLGQGDPTLFKEPIEAVAMPAQAIEGVTPFTTDSDSLYHHRVACFKLEPGTDFRQTTYYKFTINDRRAIDSLSTFRFDFDPEYERLFVNKLEVRDDKGGLVSSGDVSNYFVSSDSQGGIASQNAVLHIPINALAPGRTVELVVTRRDLSKPKALPFQRWFLISHFALERGAATVEAPDGEFAFHALNGARAVPFPGGVAFLFDRSPAWEAEPSGPAIIKFVPCAIFGANRADWPTLGREYLAKIASRLELSQPVRDLAASLVPTDAGREQTVRAIASYVQKEFGYRAIEFGPRAQIPTPAPEIITNRFGDCKDHSLLFVQLLEAAGIRAHLALAATDYPIVEDLPSRDQFNHMIAYLPEMDLFVDLTDKNTDPLGQPPYALNGHQVLVLDPAGPALKRIPDYPNPAALLETEREIEAVGRDLLVRETLTLSGLAAGWLRELAQSPKQRLIEEFAPLYSPGGAQILDVSPVDANDTSKPLKIQIKYTVPGALLDVGGHTTVTLPYIFDRRWYVLRHVDQRKTPLELPYTSTSRSTTTLKLGPGTKLIKPDSPEWRRETPAAAAERRVSTRGDDIIIETTLTLKQGDYPASDYNPSAALTSEAVAAFERDLVVTRGTKPE